jgi:hypothetical protein
VGGNTCQGQRVKLLKYVMKTDSGLAPNPYFGVCSLALCTPNHMNARLEQGDWILGHSCKATGNRLVYAMQLTHVLGMDEYFRQFPAKRPDPQGSVEQQHGDNLYFHEDGRWQRLPSAEHNSESSFLQDRARRVFLAEGEDRFWYFGADNPMPELQEFEHRFQAFVQRRQGFAYVRSEARIQEFAAWLASIGRKGLIGKPRDQRPITADRFLVALDPEPVWRELEPAADRVRPGASRSARCGS